MSTISDALKEVEAVYDRPEFADRYTVIMKNGNIYTMSEDVNAPNGLNSYLGNIRDFPSARVGKRVNKRNLPYEIQYAITLRVSDYDKETLQKMKLQRMEFWKPSNIKISSEDAMSEIRKDSAFESMLYEKRAINRLLNEPFFKIQVTENMDNPKVEKIVSEMIDIANKDFISTTEPIITELLLELDNHIPLLYKTMREIMLSRYK